MRLPNKLASMLTLTIAATAIAMPGDAAAQAYPSKPVRGIVAFGTGGQSDVVARVIAQKLSKRWNQPVVIENRAGANGNIGTEVAAKSPADGYTLYFPTSSLAVNAVIAPNAAYDPIKDFAPVTLTGVAEAVLAVNAAVPVKSLQELIAHAKANPGQLNYGTTSLGASGHVGMEQLKSIAGIQVALIPYTNIGNLITDLLTGRISMFITPPASVIAHIQAGKLRALGVTGTKRLPLLPDVPAITETLPDFRVSSWYAVVVPARTPADIIARINTDTRWATTQNDARERLAQTGVEATGSTPDELRLRIQREVATIEGLVQRGALQKQ